MCRRRDSIKAQNSAADGLTKACAARRTYVATGGKLLRDTATLQCLPESRQDFARLLDKIDRHDRGAKETKQ